MAMDRNPFQSVNERRAKLTGAATGAGACAGQAQSLNQLRQAQQQQNPPAVAGRSLISSNWRTDAGPKTMVYGVGDDNDVVTPMGNGINSVGGFDPMPASLHQNRHHQDGHQRPLQIIASPAQLRLQQVLPTIVSSTSMVAPPTTLTSSASMTTLPFSLVHESLSGHQHHHHQQSSSSPTTLERLQHQLQRQQIAEAATSSTTAATLQGAMISVPLQYQEQFQASQQQQTHVAAAVRGSSSSTSSAGSVGSTHAGRHQMQLQQQQAGQMQVRTQEAADSTTGGGGVGASNHIKLAYASTSAMSTLKPDTGAPVSGAMNSVPQAPGLTAGVGSQIFAAGAVSAATTAVVASGPDVVVLTIPVQAWNAATAYCLDRGDGFVTRLVPVDMLPVKLRDVPVRESLASSSTTLVVLPCPPMARACGSNEGYCGEVRAVGPAYLGERLLEMTPAVGILNSSGGGVLLGSVHGPAAGGVGGGAAAIAGSRTASSDDRGNLSCQAQLMDKGMVEMGRGVSGRMAFSDPVQSRIDTIVASAAQPPKRPKVYCDKWVHEGVCAFTQQGCKYKHEMPMDRATQHQLGLFHGLPAWWKKHQAELARQRNQASSKEGVRSEDQAAVADRPASVNKQNWPFGQSPGISGSGDSNSTDMLASLLMDSSTISQPQPGTRSARDLHNAATAAANRGPGGNGGGTQTVFTAAGGSRGQQQHNSSRTPSGLQQSRHNTLDSPTASSSNGGGGSNNSSSSGVRNGGVPYTSPFGPIAPPGRSSAGSHSLVTMEGSGPVSTAAVQRRSGSRQPPLPSASSPATASAGSRHHQPSQAVLTSNNPFATLELLDDTVTTMQSPPSSSSSPSGERLPRSMTAVSDGDGDGVRNDNSASAI